MDRKTTKRLAYELVKKIKETEAKGESWSNLEMANWIHDIMVRIKAES